MPFQDKNTQETVKSIYEKLTNITLNSERQCFCIKIKNKAKTPALHTSIQYCNCIRGPSQGNPVSYTHLTLPTTGSLCRSRWSPYH